MHRTEPSREQKKVSSKIIVLFNYDNIKHNTQTI